MVARMFRAKNTLLLDADKMAHKLIYFEGALYKKIKKVFGIKILRANKQIDRQKLARIVFAHPASLAKLNGMVHPKLLEEIVCQVNNSDKQIIILDAALIVGTGLERIIDKLIVVQAKKEQQILRAAKRLKLDRKEVCQRLKFQIPGREISRGADFIIDNRGTLSKTLDQVSAIRRKLWKN